MDINLPDIITPNTEVVVEEGKTNEHEEDKEKKEEIEELDGDDMNEAKKELEMINQFLMKDEIQTTEDTESTDHELADSTLEPPLTFEEQVDKLLDKIELFKTEEEDLVDNESSVKHRYLMACEKYSILPFQKCLDVVDSEILDLSDMNLGPKAFKPVIESVFFSSNLIQLLLQGNRLEAEGLVSVAYLFISNGNLTHLNYANNMIGPRRGGESLKRILAYSFSLVYLNLSQNGLVNSQVFTLLPALSEASKLEELDLSENGLSEDAGRYLGQYLSSAQSIRKLDLGYNNLGSGASSIFGGLRGNSSLNVLILTANEIGHDCAIDFARALDTNKSLEVFDIGYNRFTKETMAMISKGLKSNSTLKVLNLEHNPIFAQGAQFVIAAVAGGENKIEHLNLTGIRVNQAFLKTLVAIQSSGRTFQIEYGNRISFQAHTMESVLQQPWMKLLHLADANALSLKTVLSKIHVKFLTERREALAAASAPLEENPDLSEDEKNKLDRYPRIEGSKFVTSLTTSALKVPHGLAESLVQTFEDSKSTVDIGEIIASIPLRADILEFDRAQPQEVVADKKKAPKKK